MKIHFLGQMVGLYAAVGLFYFSLLVPGEHMTCVWCVWLATFGYYALQILCN